MDIEVGRGRVLVVVLRLVVLVGVEVYSNNIFLRFFLREWVIENYGRVVF